MAEKKKAGKPKGRPTKYSAEFHPQIAGAWAAFGLTDQEIADKMRINVDTLYEWKKRYPAFSEAVKSNREDPNKLVEGCLIQQIKGYEVDEITTFKRVDKNGKEVPAGSKTVRKHVPGNSTSTIFFLKNRMPEKWRDRHDVNLQGELTVIQKLQKMTDEELEKESAKYARLGQ